MQVLQGIHQGSREWLAIRAKHHTASEAPAMMGESRYQQRDQLLHQKHTGITQEVDGHTQKLFDRGHATEAAARLLLEQETGDDLYPVTALDDAGRLLASFDGINLMGDTGFEHKLWSERLAQQVRAGDLEPHYYWQLEQQILVGGLEKVIFVTSDGTRENWAQMEYRPAPGRAEQLLAGWAQFDADLAAYVPTAAHAAPVVAEPMESLPAVSVRLDGRLAVVSNLPDFTAALRAFIARIPAKPETDQDFANAESACKALKRAEDALTAGEESALAEMTDFEAMRRQVRDLKELARAARLATEKQVAARKEAIRGEIVASGVAAYRVHIDSLNQSLGRHYMPALSVDFGGAVKGKRTIDSLQGAVNDELARAKIAAGEVYTRIQCNLKALHSTAGDCLSLFADLPTIVTKAPDDFAALVHTRMTQHQAAEQKRLDAERERIRAEEVAKLRREEEARAHAEAVERQRQAEREAAQARRAQEEEEASARAAAAIAQAAAPALEPAMPAPAQVANVVDAEIKPGMLLQPPTAIKELIPLLIDDDGTRINLGAINEHLAPIKLDAAGLEALGFTPAAVVKASKQFRACDLPAIRAALIEHLVNLSELEAA